jgi:prepilin-type N-terminal cleavage/methylation domain-containing protein
MPQKRPILTHDNRLPRAFTLVEVLIVVVIMAVLAGVVITHYTDSSTDAKESVLKHNLHILRSQIGMYNINHFGQYPAIQDADLPQLTNATNAAGEVGAAGSAYPFGPYVDTIPPNPFNDSSEVVSVARPHQKPSAPVGESGGWQYDQTTGDIWPNNREYFK